MEALAAASSVLAVVSLALQLADNVQRLIDFWDSVKDAPIEITEIRSQLRILGALLSSIEPEASHSPNDNGGSLGNDCLLVCNESIAKLVKLSKEWDQELNRNGVRRKWVCLRKALREKELARYWSELERAKSTLIMYQCLKNGQRQESLQRLLTQMIPRPHRNQYQQSSTTRTVASSISRSIDKRFKKMHLGTTMHELHLSFGTIRVRFVKESVIDKLAQMEIIKRPWHLKIVATFLPKITSCRILECTFNHRHSSIDAGLQTFNLRPAWSPIFEYASRGDLQTVRKLLEDGLASPNDVDPHGWTILHCAAAAHQINMCQMLLTLGAVPNPVTKYQETPLHLATRKCRNMELRPKHNESASLETVRVLVEQGNNDPMQSNDIGRTPIFHASEGCTSESLAWLMNQDEFELDYNYKTSGGLTAAALMAQREDLSEALFRPLLRGGVVADARCAAKWAPKFKSGIEIEKPSMIQCAVWTWYDRLLDSYDRKFPWHPDSMKRTRLVPSPLVTIKTLLTNGADFYCNSSLVPTLLTGLVLNIVQFDGEERPLEVTRACMSTWLKLVQELGFDLKTYLRMEAEKQEGTYYDIGIGIRMTVCFDEDTIPHIWTLFQGPQERDRGAVVYRISQCANWKEWQRLYCLPKPPRLPKGYYKIWQQSKNYILVRQCNCDAQGKCRGGSLCIKEDENATELPQTTQNLRSLLFSTNASRRIISTMVCYLISASRYRYEFTFYTFLLACFFGCSYLARLWIAGGFFLTFKILQDTISYWVLYEYSKAGLIP